MYRKKNNHTKLWYFLLTLFSTHGESHPCTSPPIYCYFFIKVRGLHIGFYDKRFKRKHRITGSYISAYYQIMKLNFNGIIKKSSD